MELERLIATGGMGSVFEAKMQNKSAPFALKIVKKHMLEQFRDIQRFKRDMIDLIKVDHPFICSIRQCSETSDSFYFV